MDFTEIEINYFVKSVEFVAFLFFPPDLTGLCEKSRGQFQNP